MSGPRLYNVYCDESRLLDLWCQEDYLVVLAKRRDYWLLKTAYCTTQRGRIAKKRRERDAFVAKIKKGARND